MSILYTMIIYPLELLFEVIFAVANRVVGDPASAIIVLSLAVNFLVLPLYNRADEVQKQERDLEDFLSPGIARIKKAFTGDERMMLLQAYYRQKHYSPLYALKGSVSILLQIPFFIAAYKFLSELPLLHGASLGPVADLGMPDHLLKAGHFYINVLPVAMTLINMVSGYIYTKGMPLKSKLQLYGTAAVFLILLYDSPSGLVFYWTLNNLFSLAKNIFFKLKRPGFTFAVLCAAAGICSLIYVNVFYYTPYFSRRITLSIIAALLMLPLLIITVKDRMPAGKCAFNIRPYGIQDRTVFFISGAFMTVLTGSLIPSSVITVSPSEFMDLMNLKDPTVYIINAFLIAAGFFIIWGGVFFFLAGGNARVILSRIWLIMCPSSLVTYLFFGTDLGDISVSLVYLNNFSFTAAQKMINLAAVAAAAVITLILYRSVPKITEILMTVLLIGAAAMSILNIVPIRKEYKNNLARAESQIPVITLSAEGRNVMVIMLDRAPGFIVPYIFNEMPELKDRFDGFTVYTNTVSFGKYTKFAAPALFGGYDYTPEAMNADTDRTLVQKMNEALSVMPLIFRDAGFDVTIMDPPYAGYADPADLSVFQTPEYEGISAYHAQGVLADGFYNFDEYQDRIWRRNFFCFSVFKTVPLIMQAPVYNLGFYNQPEGNLAYEIEFSLPQILMSDTVSHGVTKNFMQAYDELKNLWEITVIDSSSDGSFMYLDNDTTHEAIMLQEPSYEPYQYVDNTEYDMNNRSRFDEPVRGCAINAGDPNVMMHYECNAASYILLGEYFDHLREEGVWDNTRIIIVADHGISDNFADMFAGGLDADGANIDAYNPVLMVKDFDSTGFTFSDEFMTNADVPFLAAEGVVDDPVNPFTGHPITMNRDVPILIYNSSDSDVDGSLLQFPENDWYLFDGSDVLDTSSWHFDGTR